MSFSDEGRLCSKALYDLEREKRPSGVSRIVLRLIALGPWGGEYPGPSSTSVPSLLSSVGGQHSFGQSPCPLPAFFCDWSMLGRGAGFVMVGTCWEGQVSSWQKYAFLCKGRTREAEANDWGMFFAWMRGLGLASPRGAEGRPAPLPSAPTSLFAQDHGASGSPSFRLIANLQGLS